MLFLVGLHFWTQQVHRELRESEEATRRLIRQFEEEQAATVPHAEQTEAADEEQAEFTSNPDTLEDISTTPLENVGGTSTAEPEIPLENERARTVPRWHARFEVGDCDSRRALFTAVCQNAIYAVGFSLQPEDDTDEEKQVETFPRSCCNLHPARCERTTKAHRWPLDIHPRAMRLFRRVR